jgi:hypothetical protein
MVKKVAVASFSYSLKDLDTIETVEREAERLRISFSDYVVRSLRASIADQKKVNAPTSIGVEYRELTTLDEFNSNIILGVKNISPDKLETNDLKDLHRTLIDKGIECAQIKRKRGIYR